MENGQQAKQTQRSSFSLKKENGKPQYLIVYTDGSVTKDQTSQGGASLTSKV